MCQPSNHPTNLHRRATSLSRLQHANDSTVPRKSAQRVTKHWSKNSGRQTALLACVDLIDTTGTKAGIPSAASAKRPSLAARIQFDRCCGARSCRRATSAITASGAIASATIRPFSSSLHRRRRTTLVTCAQRRTISVSSLMSNVDHNVHTIHDPKRITIVHHSPANQLTWGENTAYVEEGAQTK